MSHTPPKPPAPQHQNEQCIHVPPTKNPPPPPPQKQKSISIDIELKEYDKIKSQLNDIKSQIDRINQKSQKIIV